MTLQLTKPDFEVQRNLEEYYPSAASKSFTANQSILHTIGVLFENKGQKSWDRSATHPLANLIRVVAISFNFLDDETNEYVNQHFVITEREDDTPIVSLM